MDVSFLMESPTDLPDCSWQEFCKGVGIEKPDLAQDFLNELAGCLRTTRTKSLPQIVMEGAESCKKDPYLVFVWLLGPDFRPHPNEVKEKSDSCANNHYLLKIMQDECKGAAAKSWAKLLEDVMHDRVCYYEVKKKVAARLSPQCQGAHVIVELVTFDD